MKRISVIVEYAQANRDALSPYIASVLEGSHRPGSPSRAANGVSSLSVIGLSWVASRLPLAVLNEEIVLVNSVVVCYSGVYFRPCLQVQCTLLPSSLSESPREVVLKREPSVQRL